MRYLSAAVALTLICAIPAAGQSIDAPLVFEVGDPAPLAGAAPAKSAMAGDAYLLPFAVRNRSGQSIQLRRITLRVPDGMEIVNPLVDGIDNDRDGIVDEGDEGFSKTDDIAIAWRIDEAFASIPAGATVERAVTVKLSDIAEPGAELDLALIAGAAAADVTLRAEADVSFALVPPTITTTLNGTTDEQLLSAQDTPSWEMVMTVPSGQISGFGMIVNASPAVLGYKTPKVRLGKGVRCDTPPTVTKNGRSLTAQLSQCRADRTAPLSDRTIGVEASLELSDADPFADPEQITARRAIRAAAAVTRDGKAFGEAVIATGQIFGPLLGARLVSVSDKSVDAGDSFSATYRLINRGDTSTNDLRLKVTDDGAVDCRSLVASGQQKRSDGCKGGLPLPPMAAGASRDLTASVAFLDKAHFKTDTALRLSLHGKGLPALALPFAEPNFKKPSAPALSLSSGGDWKTTDGVVTARIGDAGRVTISGSLIEGRYDANLRLLSRVVDAQTGEPIAAAPMRIERFNASSLSGAEFNTDDKQLSTTTEEGWSVASLPLENLIVPVDADSAPGYIAEAVVSLLDTSEMQSERLIELRTELAMLGTSSQRGDDWIEVLIVEPSLDVTVHSTDQDRTLNLHEITNVAVLSCNRGKSSADALVLTARFPASLEPENLDNAKLRTVHIERANDNTALFADEARSAGSIHFDEETATLRGALSSDKVLPPETCLAMVFEVRRSDISSRATTGEILAAVEPFTGRDGAQARIYPGLDTGRIAFELPRIFFGPSSEKEANDERLITHQISLEIPDLAGPHRVNLSTDSSTGLDWTILRLDENGMPQPWRNGETITPGQITGFQLEALGPEQRPLGWTDTTLVRAVAFSDSGSTISATTRVITRRRGAPGGRIDVTKRMALDRDCDGDLNDERIQDSLFEPVKDATVGDCVIFHVRFRHAGERSMERIIVRDQVPDGTELRNGAIEVLRAPEPSQETDITEPEQENRDVVWTFEGLFEPGVEGEVSYAVKILDQP